ncbi:uncharacterized protein At4g04775-like [Vicia villosa]|uniref:uncharacterized protein At4g04775-like n=1 Tax=Vicia villosa TaxID=3911 RepID=UPI00273C4175|nr:uncharacterized protein At4g04775-like [Vicia villosa]XP_058765316.1 uncharacterized protein At4g04775-like [Vicia villosa]
MGSESVQISSSSSHSRRRRLHCYCGLDSPLVTSWTSQNPGRRFYGCGLYKLQGRKGCSFFDWYDEQITDRSQEVINSLLKKVTDLKKNDGLAKKIDDDLKKKMKILVILLIFSWVLIIILIIRNLVG